VRVTSDASTQYREGKIAPMPKHHFMMYLESGSKAPSIVELGS
jgi:hypothetical protein